MEKEWYIVYTKKNAEIKVCDSLAKRKIAFYCPTIVSREKEETSRGKKELLFKSYVFVLASEEDLITIKQINHVINLVYWLGRPATIKNEEVQLIQKFTTNYKNIRLEKFSVNRNSKPEVIVYSKEYVNVGAAYTKNNEIKAILPSLGFMLLADFTKIEEEVKIEFNKNVEDGFLIENNTVNAVV